MPDPMFPRGQYPDPFGGEQLQRPAPPGAAAGALGYGRMNDATSLPAGANSEFQASWQRARGGVPAAPPTDPNAMTTVGYNPPPMDPAAQYAQLFGTTTPQTRVAGGLPTTGPIMPVMPAPGGPRPASPPRVPPNGGGANNAPKPPGPSPQQAGQNNSIMPGWSTGNTQVGVAAPEDKGVSTTAAVQPPAQGKYPPLPTDAPVEGVPPQQQPGVKVGTYPPMTGGASIMESPQQQAQAAVMESPQQTQEPVAGPAGEARSAPAQQQVYYLGAAHTQGYDAPPPPNWQNMGPAARSAWKQQHAITAPGGAGGNVTPPPIDTGTPVTDQGGTTQDAAAQPINVNGISYNLNAGVALPAAWNSLTLDQKRDFIQTHGTPVSPLQQTAMQTLNKYADLTDLTLPTQNPVTGGHAVIGSGMSPNDISAALGNDPSLNRLALEGQKLQDKLNSGGVGQVAITANELTRLNDIKTALGGYGVTFGEPTTGGDGTGDGGQQQTDPDAEIAQGGDTYQKLVNYFSSKGWGDQSPAMAEQAMSWQQQQLENTNRQTAATGFSDAANAFKNSPLFSGSQDLAAERLSNPDPTDWNAIRSQAIAAEHKQGQDALRSLSASAGRRLGSSGLGAVTGMAGDIQRQANSDLTNQLGQLKIQESQGKAQAERNAISEALAVLGGTEGQATGNAATLGNIVAGNPADYTNSAAGIAAAISNINAAQAAADAAKQAGQFSWQDAAQIVGTLAGSVLGGPIGGALVGGATKAATDATKK